MQLSEHSLKGHPPLSLALATAVERAQRLRRLLVEITRRLVSGGSLPALAAPEQRPFARHRRVVAQQLEDHEGYHGKKISILGARAL